MTGACLQVILAKVLRSTPKHLLVDPGYYGLNVVARQVCVCVGGGEPLVAIQQCSAVQ
jgi:hypothetical protein